MSKSSVVAVTSAVPPLIRVGPSATENTPDPSPEYVAVKPGLFTVPQALISVEMDAAWFCAASKTPFTVQRLTVSVFAAYEIVTGNVPATGTTTSTLTELPSVPPGAITVTTPCSLRIQFR